MNVLFNAWYKIEFLDGINMIVKQFARLFSH